MLSASSQFRYRSLQFRKEFARVCAVHLCMMKLERHCELTAKKAAAVPTPNQERIVKNAAVHAHGTVQLRFHNCGSADYHAVRNIVIGAGLCSGAGQIQIIGIESCNFRAERNIA